MNSWIRISITIIATLCQIFAFFTVLTGDMTAAPISGMGKIVQGENLNDVHTIMQNTNGDIYTMGYTCIQKFNEFGEFIGGAYYDSNSLKHVSNNEYLSLNEQNVVVLNCGDNLVYIFDDEFNLIEKIGVEQSYNANRFYSDYPNTETNNKEIKLSFFNNTVQIGKDIIQLDAPRNRWFSRDIGLLILVVSIFSLLSVLKINKKGETLGDC